MFKGFPHFEDWEKAEGQKQPAWSARPTPDQIAADKADPWPEDDGWEERYGESRQNPRLN